MSTTCHSVRAQCGFALPAAIFLMVILALLGAFIVRINTIQISSLATDALGTVAYQAARAGTEWGAYQSLRNNSCAGTTLTFAGTSLAPFTTAVSCARTTANELGTVITIDQITATACNQPPCPNNAPGANYLERKVTITVGQ
jgi:MSHA biogenesis protein MshP